MGIRLDIYGGYADEKKPDPDHIYSWKQHSHETAQDYLERILAYITDIVEHLDEDNDTDD